jgi:hypothetical protein
VKGPAAWNLNLVMTPEDYAARRAQAEAAHRGDPPPEPEREVPPEQGPTVPPNPLVTQFTVLDRELLVVAVHLPAENWHEARSISAIHELYDTVLDLVDVATGAVLARTRIPGWGRFTSDGTLYVPRESPIGLIYFDAWEISAQLDSAEVGRIRSELGSVASDAGASR